VSNEGKDMSKPETSSRGVTSVVLRYGLAVVSVAIALGLALLAQLQAFHNVEIPLFLMSVAVAVWYAGPKPGVLAVVLAGPELQLLLHGAPALFLHPPS
jgi:K+-sensing histidine kinase KdpD